ncbi:MAG: glycoside hydrolase [Planctomycetes bacterium]|nr:glycoside hydrolase [Planctomycetota bacterium]
MPSIEILSTGLVYRNPKPHLVSRHAYFPSLVQLPGGELLAGFDTGQAFEAVDVRSYCSRSADGGQTWSEPSLIFKPDESKHPVSTTCRLSRAPDGRIMGFGCEFDRTVSDEGLGNSKTQGFVPGRMILVESKDQGRTWSTPRPMNNSTKWDHLEVCSPLIYLDANRWIVPTSTWPDWQGSYGIGLKGLTLASDDAGKTWPHVTVVHDGTATRTTTWEQKYITLSDGRIMALCWRFSFATSANLPNGFAFSRDGGRTFSPVVDAPLLGETATPVALPDNHFLVIYRRADVKGLWAHLGKIEGDKWIRLADEPVWGVQGDASYSRDAKNKMEQFTSLKFGCPTVTRLPDGTVLSAFWCVEENASNIRWHKIRVK